MNDKYRTYIEYMRTQQFDRRMCTDIPNHAVRVYGHNGAIEHMPEQVCFWLRFGLEVDFAYDNDARQWCYWQRQ